MTREQTIKATRNVFLLRQGPTALELSYGYPCIALAVAALDKPEELRAPLVSLARLCLYHCIEWSEVA